MWSKSSQRITHSNLVNFGYNSKWDETFPILRRQAFLFPILEIFRWDIYQTRCSRDWSTNSFVIHSLTPSVSQWCFMAHHYTRIASHCPIRPVSARKLKFWQKVHLPPTCHVSHVTCHMSHVMSHVSLKTVKKNGKSGKASRRRLWYWRGYPV